jgi:glycosyltransferase involved in cell wall biosynthesis
MMRALERVLLDHPLRERMRQRGYDQVKKFSWDSSAAEILAGYQEVTGCGSNKVRERKAAIS